MEGFTTYYQGGMEPANVESTQAHGEIKFQKNSIKK